MTDNEAATESRAAATDSQDAPTYAESRTRQVTSATQVRLYGVPLKDANNLEGHTAIIYCGFQSDGIDLRECTDRIWHVPDDGISSFGALEDFPCERGTVHYFDVAKDATPIEEQYVPISLGLVQRDALKAQAGVTSPQTGVLAARIGDIVSPNAQALPAAAMIGARPWGNGGRLGAKYITGNTSWMWTAEAGDRSRYDPVNDPDEVEMYV